MQRKSIVASNICFTKNVFIIYLLIFLFVSSIITTGFFIKTISADSNNYYVSTTGNNGYNGLYPTYQGGSNGPWLTIEYAATQVTNGDTVNILAGTYTPSSNIVIDNKQSSNNWLTFRNYNDDVVKIEGNNCPITSVFEGTFCVIRSKYLRFSGLIINNSAVCGISIYAGFSGQPYPCYHICVDNCTISNCSASAFVTLSHNHNITFEHNYVYNNFNDWSCVGSGQEVISFQGITTFSINNNTIINNRVENIDVKAGCNHGEICYNYINNTGEYTLKMGSYKYCGGPGIMLDAAGGISHNLLVFNNYIIGNNTGITLNNEGSVGHYEYIQIYNNIINLNKLGDTTAMSYPAPLGLFNTDLSSEIYHNISIYSNTIHNGDANNYATFEIGHYSQNQFNSDNLKDLYVYNNIFSTDYTGSSNVIAGHRLLPTDIYLKNNTFYRESGTLQNRWNLNIYTNQTEWNFGSGRIIGDPKYIDTSSFPAENLHLQSSSPCIDTANSTLVPGFDYDGVPRPQGAGYDIGSYEFSSFYDNTPPQIFDLSIATSSPLDIDLNYGWENISCTVTDNIEVDAVYIKIVFPNNDEINIEMIKIADSDCYYYNSSWFNYGNYSYYIIAYDTYQNIKYSNIFFFSLPPNWDINNDGRCSILDILLVSNHYDEIGPNGWIREDVDNNGIINILDMSSVSNYYEINWYY